MPKSIQIMIYSVLTGTAAALIWMFWSLLWPFNLLESDERAWLIINQDKVVHRGETALIHWKGCRYTDLPAYISTELRGPILVTLAERVSTTKPGCQELNFPIVNVGPEIPLGKYTARVIITFNVNPIRTIKYIYETDSFEVVP